MKFEYDEDADALYIEFSADDVEETKEVQEGVLIDFDARGEVCGIEILHVSKRDWFDKSEIERFALKGA